MIKDAEILEADNLNLQENLEFLENRSPKFEVKLPTQAQKRAGNNNKAIKNSQEKKSITYQYEVTNITKEKKIAADQILHALITFHNLN